MASIKIQDKGFYTTIQDLGREKYASLGVPVSGAMDQKALRLSNLLLNNPENAAALECTLVGPVVVFLKKIAFVLTGAQSMSFLDQQAITTNQVYIAQKGQVLQVGKVTTGCRVYLGLDGGIDTVAYLESKSLFYPISPMAIIKTGLFLKTAQSNFGEIKGARLQSKITHYLENSNLTAFKGPEFHLLSSKSLEKLLSTRFSIGSGNRMGTVLSPILEKHIHKMLTGPVLPGTVQLTPSGALFILSRDCQPTGGYPRILQFTEASINSLAQKKMGDIFQIALK